MSLNFRNGFSLIELSIVLVIIGLLVGGTLTGRHLIRASELRSVTTEYQKYYTAVKSFREKYFALPGDMTNATQFWGAEGTPTTDLSCANATFSAAPSTKTCDGNGDGRLEYTPTMQEPMRLWQHLANAGLIPAVRYLGSAGTDHCYYNGPTPPPGCPRARLSNGQTSRWNIDSEIQITSELFLAGGYSSDAVWAQYGNSMWVGGNPYGMRIMTAPEVYNIDTKIDDGKPARGKVVTYSGVTLALCTTTSDQTNLDAEYLRDESNSYTRRKLCSIIFRNQF